MKIRTILFYLVTLITGGQFAVVWAFLMAQQVNAKQSGFIPHLWARTVIFSSMYFAFMVVIGDLVYLSYRGGVDGALPFAEEIYVALLIAALAILALFAQTICMVAGFVRAKQVDIPANSVLLLLLLIYGSSMPLLQARLDAACE